MTAKSCLCGLFACAPNVLGLFTVIRTVLGTFHAHTTDLCDRQVTGTSILKTC